MERLTHWRPKHKYRHQSEPEKAKKRERHRIIAVGSKIPSLIKSFHSMRIPKGIIAALKSIHIKRPTSLQRQGLPSVLMGRDTLLVSISREGKTLAFMLPLIIGSIEEELRLSLSANEGPIGLVIAPSRELAFQIYAFTKSVLNNLKGYPRLKVCLCTGGVDMQSQISMLSEGVHIIISTPGRLSDMIGKNKINLKLCKVLVLDEADRLLDLGFDEEVRAVLSHTNNLVQIVLSSSSIPKRMQEFATNFMKAPVYISSSKELLKKKIKVTQISELVTNEEKNIKLLEVLARTDPPILVFCENKNESDGIFQYLHQRKIECIGLHGGKNQNEREKALRDFNKGSVSVLIATDIAAKGLSFEEVKHVINYEMPKDLDGYIQRISRAKKRAVVSNFLNFRLDKIFLKEFCEFLVDMGQEVPAFLGGICESNEEKCLHCGIKGHRKSMCYLLQYECLKLELPLINT